MEKLSELERLAIEGKAGAVVTVLGEVVPTIQHEVNGSICLEEK